MARAEWDPQLETGDALVDDQHRAIYELFNELDAAQGRPDEIMSVLQRLVDYTLVHFSVEEGLMRQTKYPPSAIEQHINLHRKLTQDTRDMILDFRAGKLVDAAPLVAFLREWINVHLNEHDRALVEHLRARGARAVLPAEVSSAPSQL
jgi:hemerythrin